MMVCYWLKRVVCPSEGVCVFCGQICNECDVDEKECRIVVVKMPARMGNGGSSKLPLNEAPILLIYGPSIFPPIDLPNPSQPGSCNSVTQSLTSRVAG